MMNVKKGILDINTIACWCCFYLVRERSSNRYTCKKGRFNANPTTPRFFAYGGIRKPNKKVAEFQKDCPDFSSLLEGFKDEHAILYDERSQRPVELLSKGCWCCINLEEISANKCRFVKGFFDKDDKTPRGFARNGVLKPNKQIAEIQKSCPEFSPLLNLLQACQKSNLIKD